MVVQVLKGANSASEYGFVRKLEDPVPMAYLMHRCGAECEIPATRIYSITCSFVLASPFPTDIQGCNRGERKICDHRHLDCQSVVQRSGQVLWAMVAEV